MSQPHSKPEITPKQKQQRQAALSAALLDWHLAMGCDAAISDQATDWLSKGETAPGADLKSAIRKTDMPQKGEPLPPVQKGQARATAATPTPSANPGSPQTRRPADAPSPTGRLQTSGSGESHATPDRSIATAAKIAASCMNLEDLSKAITAFDGCGLKRTAKNVCVYRGTATTRLAIVGEAPGRDEDLQGKPFVGRAGQLLDRMLAAIGLSETDVHITNIVYWRPPGNRAPTPQEAATCRPFLERQIELVDPDVLLLMGGSAAKQILETKDGIMRMRGKWKMIEIGGQERKCLATLHPAYLLRTPSAKHMAWKDLQAVKKFLGETVGTTEE